MAYLDLAEAPKFNIFLVFSPGSPYEVLRLVSFLPLKLSLFNNVCFETVSVVWEPHFLLLQRFNLKV